MRGRGAVGLFIIRLYGVRCDRKAAVPTDRLHWGAMPTAAMGMRVGAHRDATCPAGA
jgi:hypothetical protein